MGQGASKAHLRDALASFNDHDISLEDGEYWAALWKFNTTPQEIFELVSPNDVRRLRRERPGNVTALFAQSVAKLCATVENPTPTEFDEALTAVRLLTRVMPFLLEGYRDVESGATDPFLESLFWGARPPAVGAAGSGQQQPLGTVLVKAVMLLLFLPGFTTAAAADPNAAFPGDPNYDPLVVHQPALCWQAGLAAAAGAGGGSGGGRLHGWQLERNRVEVMRLLLTLLSEPLYVRSEDPNLFLGAFAQEIVSADTPHASELFVSLMNVVLSFDPVGWGVPYGSSVASDVPLKQLNLCAQLLVALLDCTKPVILAVVAEDRDGGDGGGNGSAAAAAADPSSSNGPEGAGFIAQPPPLAPGTPGYNVFIAMLQSLEGPEDLAFVYTGLLRLLNNVHEARNTYLPGTMMQVTCYQELLVLLWKLMCETPEFLRCTLRACEADKDSIGRLLGPLLFLALEYRRDPGRIALEHILTYLLLTLSGERSFGVALNQPYPSPSSQRLPVDLPLFTGTYADLLIVSLHKLVVGGSERLNGLYSCYLTIICNISPYCRSLSQVASVKLLNLFELFTAPRVLYAVETNHVCVSLLLEIFNNLVQYQYAGNQHLVYAIVRRKEAFERLNNLSLSSALEAANDHASAAAEGTASSSAGGTRRRGSGSRSSSIDGESANGVGGAAAAAAAAAREDAAASAAVERKEEVAAAGKAPAATAAGGSGEGRSPRFIPTVEWLEQVKAQMRLNTIMGLLRHLVPLVDDFCERTKPGDEAIVIDFLRNTTMVGLLPVPHPIISRKFQPNYFTALWFTSFMWSVIFQYNQELPMWDGQKVRLFTVTFA